MSMGKRVGPKAPKPRNSEMLTVRVRADVRESLEQITKQRGLTVSRHVQRALDQYIERSKRQQFTAEAIREGLAQLFRAFVTDETNIKEFIPPKLAKEFAVAKRQVTPKLIGKREAVAVLREAWASSKPEDFSVRFEWRKK